MRLLFLVLDRTDYAGGPAINMRRLLPELKKRGHDVHVICLYRGSHPNADFLEKMGIPCYYNISNHVSMQIVPWILKIAQKVRPDVFIPDASTQGLLAGRWLRESNIPFVNTMRGNDDLNKGKAAFFSEPSDWQSDALVFVSSYLQKQTNEFLKTKLHQTVIPSGVQMSRYHTDQEGERVGVVYSGRLTNRIKNVSQVLKIFIALAKAYPETFYAFIGSGEEENSLRAEIEKHDLIERIQVVAPLQDEEYKKFLSAYHIITLASDSEGMPGAIMDGMSCGLIPVVAPFKGIEELVIQGETGFVSTDYFDAMIADIESCFQDGTLRKRISENAIKHIADGFSITICADRWEALFDKLQTKETIKEIVIPKRLDFPASPLLLEHKLKSPIRLKLYQSYKRVKNLLNGRRG